MVLSIWLVSWIACSFFHLFSVVFLLCGLGFFVCLFVCLFFVGFFLFFGGRGVALCLGFILHYLFFFFSNGTESSPRSKDGGVGSWCDASKIGSIDIIFISVCSYHYANSLKTLLNSCTSFMSPKINSNAVEMKSPVNFRGCHYLQLELQRNKTSQVSVITF